jgi:hypothetical protein
MGGSGSGRRWHYGAKDTTNDCRALDVRGAGCAGRWQRDGLLTPGQSFRSFWTRNGEEVASINIRTETGRVILAYRHQRSGEDWRPWNTPCAWTGRLAATEGNGRGSYARRKGADGEWRSCTAARSSPVAIAANWPIQAKGNALENLLAAIRAQHDAYVDVSLAGIAEKLGLTNGGLPRRQMVWLTGGEICFAKSA